MELTEHELFMKNMLNVVDIAIEILFYLTNMNLLVCCVATMLLKHELSKSSKKEINFIIRIKNAEFKKFCLCVDVYKIYESDDYDKI